MKSASILVVTGLAREARIAAGPGLVTLAGGGAGGLAARIEAAVREHRPEAIVSFGLAGALAPGLRPGDLVVGAAVLADEQRFDCDPVWWSRIMAVFDPAYPRPRGELEPEAVVLGSAGMITLAEAKRILHAQTGAVIVDMESAAAARVAAAYALPLAVIRAVSDSADQSLPKAVLKGMKPDGGMDLKGVLGSLARDPRQLPALIRTGREAERGFKALERASLQLRRSGALSF